MKILPFVCALLLALVVVARAQEQEAVSNVVVLTTADFDERVATGTWMVDLYVVSFQRSMLKKCPLSSLTLNVS